MVSLAARHEPKDGFSRALEIAAERCGFRASEPGLLPRLREIVYGKAVGKWGMAWGEATRKAAVARARASCGDLSTCPTEVSFFGTECGVFAYSASGWAIAARDDIRKARETAVSECRKRGSANQRVTALGCG